MAKTRTRSLGVDWHLPAKRHGFAKRSFATTTRASSDLIVLLAGRGYTWSQIAATIRFDDDAKRVAETFIAEGYGDVPARDHVGGWL